MCLILMSNGQGWWFHIMVECVVSKCSLLFVEDYLLYLLSWFFGVWWLNHQLQGMNLAWTWINVFQEKRLEFLTGLSGFFVLQLLLNLQETGNLRRAICSWYIEFPEIISTLHLKAIWKVGFINPEWSWMSWCALTSICLFEIVWTPFFDFLHVWLFGVT